MNPSSSRRRRAQRRWHVQLAARSRRRAAAGHAAATARTACRSQGRCGYGTRMPLLVISPFAKRNYVDHTLTDQTLDPEVRRGQLARRASASSRAARSTPSPAPSRTCSTSRSTTRGAADRCAVILAQPSCSIGRFDRRTNFCSRRRAHERRGRARAALARSSRRSRPARRRAGGGGAAAAQPVAPLHPEPLARFVDALPIPPSAEARRHAARPDGSRHERIRVLPHRDAARRTSRCTAICRRRASGPTAAACPVRRSRCEAGEPVLVEWRNELPGEALPAHRPHAVRRGRGEPRRAHRRARARRARAAGERRLPRATGSRRASRALVPLPNQQDAATLWYHDHAMGIERLNQYAGLFGDVPDPRRRRGRARAAARRARDPARALSIACSTPTGSSATRSRRCRTRRGFGGVRRRHPRQRQALPVPGGRAAALPLPHRQRVERALLLSVARATAQPFHQIGTDQGLLAAPVAVEDADAGARPSAPTSIVDFAPPPGSRCMLQSQALRADAVPRRAEPGVRKRGRAAGAAAPGRRGSRERRAKTRASSTLERVRGSGDAHAC